MTANPDRVIDRAFIDRQQIIRRAMLHELYALAVRDDPRMPGFTRDLTHALGHAPDECQFALKVLTGLGYVRQSALQCCITPQGIAYFEQEFQ